MCVDDPVHAAKLAISRFTERRSNDFGRVENALGRSRVVLSLERENRPLGILCSFQDDFACEIPHSFVFIG
jgi:hypothetical protein